MSRWSSPFCARTSSVSRSAKCNGLAPFALDHQLGDARLEGLDLIALRERVVCCSCGNQERADQQADETAGTHSAASHAEKKGDQPFAQTARNWARR